MILIFGGVYQGKLAYALERFNLSDSQVYRCNDDAGKPCGKKVIYEIDRWILALVRSDADVPQNIESFIENNQQAIVICNDISGGVVPVCDVLRKWREETGKAMAVLARQSDEVIRLFCGIPINVK